MLSEYELNFVESLSSPLSEVKSDETTLGSDARQHLSEMRSLGGGSAVKYGGEEPWTHCWRGSFKPAKVPDMRVGEDAGFEEKAEYAIDSLLTFFGSGCTPHNAGVDDFEWTVEVNTEPPSIISDGVFPVKIMWEPKE